MSAVKVLGFVSRELKGRILTVSSVSAFVAAEKAADRLNMTATSQEAAELAVLLPKAPLERIREEFGPATADIFKALRPSSPYSKIAAEAMALYGRSEGDSVRRDAAIAACAAETAVASLADREGMVQSLDLMAGHETDPERKAFLEELCARLPGPDPADLEGESHSRTKVISISMDVCGSTEAKTRMKTCARDEKELDKWYKAFHREFLLLEWRFYTLLFQAPHGQAGWDWKHGFVVKGIGDEIWLLYEVDEKDHWKLGPLVAHLLHSALNVASRLIDWTSAPDDDENGRSRHWETRRLPLKFYIDIIDDVFEVSGPRRDFMTDRLPEILGAEESWSSGDFIELGNRLHAGSLMGDGRRLITAIRTDFIGCEVDRFFRATKFALPGVVTVGRALFEKVVDVSAGPDGGLGGTGLQKAVVECPIHQSGDARFDYDFRYVMEYIRPDDLKGMGEGYVVYRVVRESDLLKLRHTGADEAIMAETFEVFTPAMEWAVRAALQE